MQRELAELLAEMSGGEYEVDAEYSGRGMYGDTTAGIIGPGPEYLATMLLDIIKHSHIDAEELAEIKLSHFRVDSMGYDTIIY